MLIYALTQLFIGSSYGIINVTIGVTSFTPRFAESRVTVDTDLFKEVKLECTALADPYTVYKWSKRSSIQNGGISMETGVSVNSHNSTLIFRNITWQDRGLIYCNAWNSKGYASKEYDINVRRK